MGASQVLRVIGDNISSDSSKQISLDDRVTLLHSTEQFNKVLDVGCGCGRSFDFFKSLDTDIEWTGVDIGDSSEVNQRKRTDCDFVQFNGIDIPFPDNQFDLIYSDQVFEHVRFPEKLLSEIYRVLKPGGYFIGSTSQLEPYHSHSIFNYTPYGFKLILEDANFINITLAPSIDGLTLIWRRIFGGPKSFNRWFEKDSPLNTLISWLGKLSKRDHRKINAAKLLFCGQFCFLAKK